MASASTTTKTTLFLPVLVTQLFAGKTSFTSLVELTMNRTSSETCGASTRLTAPASRLLLLKLKSAPFLVVATLLLSATIECLSSEES